VIEVEPLRTILQMESQRGYSNTTVVGGLDRYIVHWARQSKNRSVFPKELNYFKKAQFSSSYYASLDEQKRKLWIAKLLNWLNAIEEPTVSEPQIQKQERYHIPIDKSKASPIPPPNTIDSPVTVLKGIKAAMAAKLGRLCIKTIRDILYFFPRRHIDYTVRKPISEIVTGEDQTILATVWESKVTNFGRQKGTEVTLGDETGNMRAVWFNQPYLAGKFITNSRLMLSGKVSEYKGRLFFESPEWDIVEDKEIIHAGRMVPIYSLSSGVFQRQIRTLVKKTIDEWIKRLVDFLPEETKTRCELVDLSTAILHAHFPKDIVTKNESRKRLAFDELFLIQLGVLNKKRVWQQGQPGNSFDIKVGFISNFLGTLTFGLTMAQHRVLNEIVADLQKTIPMSRLLQGEVGSGKTVVAIAALLAAVNAGFQGALMAPTEILAEQHYLNTCNLLSRISKKSDQDGNSSCFEGSVVGKITLSLLTGGIHSKEKNAARQNLLENNTDIVIGTHALIQKGVEFNKLGLVVIDEQHRFGVLQRSALRQKGFNPHLLVMTATPIPRTLALTLYGDLDLSIIDELPPGRQTIKTKWLNNEDRDQAYEFIRNQIAMGRQAFIICPLIEESDTIEAKAATVEYERLSKMVFPELKLGLLHGRILADEKDTIMRQFRDGTLDILVSTPVVEVGIDIPNATVMLIEAANRFGLSQLHQFRGRVGRGKDQSYCLLLSENPSEEGQARLKAIEEINDGFELAERDLELRGPGEIFGTKQSGLPDLRMAKLSDIQLLELARKEADTIFKEDPGLKYPKNRLLSLELARVWPGVNEWS
jgi:ATP-dependent DNA helicase RecG